MKILHLSSLSPQEYTLEKQDYAIKVDPKVAVVVVSWAGQSKVKVLSFPKENMTPALMATYWKKVEAELATGDSQSKPHLRLFSDGECLSYFLSKGLKNKSDQFKHIPIVESEFELRVKSDGSGKVGFFQQKTNKKIKVLVVDDSKTMRDLLAKIIARDSSLEFVAAAELPSQVEALIQQHKPDVMTLDINMPEMDGVTLLEKLLPKYGIPTLMISAVSLEEGHQVLKALRIGAVDYIQKPNLKDLPIVAPTIIEKIKMAVAVKVHPKAQVTTERVKPHKITQRMRLDKIIAIGASTGGTEAIREVLERLPSEIPPIVITQHIPPVFSKAFATRLNDLLPFEVLEAKDGDEIKPNRVLIAPGGYQMKVKKIGDKSVVKVLDEAPVNRHKPSVDVLFDSVAEQYGKNCIGVILTGMGADGAKGLLNLRNAGAYTIAQSEKDCIVFGMPREAIELGAAHEVAHLFDVAESIAKQLLPVQIKKPAA